MSEAEEKKIIIDEDWKSQVEREREELKHREQAGEQAAPESLGPLPPASFPMLVTTLVTQAMAAMGQIPNPATGKAEKELALAKHQIDTLTMLQEKTKGNLDPEEVAMLEEALHQLRMLYVTSSN